MVSTETRFAQNLAIPLTQDIKRISPVTRETLLSPCKKSQLTKNSLISRTWSSISSVVLTLDIQLLSTNLILLSFHESLALYFLLENTYLDGKVFVTRDIGTSVYKIA